MSMLEPDWDDTSSLRTDRRRVWEELCFEVESFEDSRIDDCLDALRRTRRHGDARLGSFHVCQHKVFDWFASGNCLEEISFFDRFLSLPSVWALLPDPGIPEVEEDLDWPPEFEWGSAFKFDGEVAERIVQGGCYEDFPGTPTEAVWLARNFRDALFGERYNEIRPYTSFDRWHPWFDCVEHHTWLLVDKRYRRIWVLCLTDTD